MSSNVLPEGWLKHIVVTTKKQGGVLVMDCQVIESSDEPNEADLEEYPRGYPDMDERKIRESLHNLARRALQRSRDEHPSCLRALETLKSFCDGDAGYRDLALARARMQGRSIAAGLGVIKGCANAASTLACYHACHPDLVQAIRLTRKFARLTFQFIRERKGI